MSILTPSSVSELPLEAEATAAQTLARFAHAVQEAAELDPALENKVTQLIADQIGLQLACADLPWSVATRNYHTRFAAEGGACVVGYGDKLNPEAAAFINGAFGHGQDFDDTCQLVQTHPGAVIVSVGFAMGQHLGSSGRQVFRAIVAGYEVMLRAAHSVSPGCLRRGFHTPQATGPFGAAVTAGLLLGLDEDQLAQALAIAGSFSGGLIEYTQSGGSVKRIHCAIATTSGIRAAYLAAEGMTGPLTVFEGKKGFIKVYSDTPAPERLLDRLGEHWLIPYVSLKNYNCCYFIHAPLEAVLAIVRENNLRPEDIDRIEIGTSAHGTTHVGAIQHPTDALGGQFSTAFTIALSLLRELPGVNSYTDEQLADPALQSFADRVVVREDEVAESEYPENWGAVAHVTTKDGRRFSHRARYPKGTAQNPLSNDEVWQKIAINNPAIPTDQLARLRNEIERLNTIHNVADMAGLMTHPELDVRRDNIDDLDVELDAA